MQQEARNSAIGADENKPRRVGEIKNVVIMGIAFYRMLQIITLKMYLMSHKRLIKFI